MTHRCRFIQVSLYPCVCITRYMDWYGIESVLHLGLRLLMYSVYCIHVLRSTFNNYGSTCNCNFIRFIRTELPHDSSEREAPPKGQTALTLLYGSKALRDAYGSIFNLYEKFCGPIHFRALSNLLGYQGIAMLLEELMNVVENQVATPSSFSSSSSSSSSSSYCVYGMLYFT